VTQILKDQDVVSILVTIARMDGDLSRL